MRWVILGALAATNVMADTVIISWSPTEEDIDGYRVYEYTEEAKVLVYEGLETSYRQEQEESTVFGVAQFKEDLESEVIPRAVIIKKRRPTTIRFEVEIE